MFSEGTSFTFNFGVPNPTPAPAPFFIDPNQQTNGGFTMNQNNFTAPQTPPNTTFYSPHGENKKRVHDFPSTMDISTCDPFSKKSKVKNGEN